MSGLQEFEILSYYGDMQHHLSAHANIERLKQDSRKLVDQLQNKEHQTVAPATQEKLAADRLSSSTTIFYS